MRQNEKQRVTRLIAGPTAVPHRVRRGRTTAAAARSRGISEILLKKKICGEARRMDNRFAVWEEPTELVTE